MLCWHSVTALPLLCHPPAFASPAWCDLWGGSAPDPLCGWWELGTRWGLQLRSTQSPVVSPTPGRWQRGGRAEVLVGTRLSDLCWWGQGTCPAWGCWCRTLLPVRVWGALPRAERCPGLSAADHSRHGKCLERLRHDVPVRRVSGPGGERILCPVVLHSTLHGVSAFRAVTPAVSLSRTIAFIWREFPRLVVLHRISTISCCCF